MNRFRRIVSAILALVTLFLLPGAFANPFFRSKTDTARFLRVQPLSVDQWLHSADDRTFFAAIACLDALCLFPEDLEEQALIRGILDGALDADGIRIADKELLPDGSQVSPEDVRNKLDTVLRIYEYK